MDIELQELIREIEGAELTGDGSMVIKQLEYDSRSVKENALFFAIKGYQHDGHEFLEQAKSNGAVAALGEGENGGPINTYVRVPDGRRAMADVSAKFYGYPGRRIKACGVTGTNGKTTTCFLLRSVLEARNKTTGLVTSQIYDTGRDRFTAERTTPESLDMQRLLFLMKKNYCVNAVIEVSSHALVLHRVDNINFRVAVYTNLTRDHLDFHQDMEAYFQAKAILARNISGPLGYVVVNLDVPEFRPLFGEVTSSFMTYSLENKEADVYCGDRELKPDGTIFDLVTPMGTRTVSLRLPGRFNLMNALAAASGGLACGVDIESVVDGLERVPPPAGRLNPIQAGQPFSVYVDYAHTPDAIARLCEAVRELCVGRLLLMFGCGGDRDKGKRPQMGSTATENADVVVVTSDNPRNEDPLAIIKDIKPGLKGQAYEIEADRRDAIASILRKAKPGDAVLLAGKGAEPYQEIGGTRHPFDDTKEAKQVLASLGYND
ncbi:MAG: UDP-N-acetylmuramoyl-L-alanyl-D-glutamate--2,6-diaminopimelate ligase [Candidatus Zixiibacteriota bacterium]|nr:MAG: UDP-N-acetylmuramoyl-L-alanyl-D-glutamate--2,6-diaminopimelate ligase [candidate division Zixibacteria bacterium]